MTDLPAERRTEYRRWAAENIGAGHGTMTVGCAELVALLDATEPVADAEVREAHDNLLGIAGVLYEKKCPDDAGALIEAAALLERQARQLADLRAGRIGVDRVESQPFTPPHEDE